MCSVNSHPSITMATQQYMDAADERQGSALDIHEGASRPCLQREEDGEELQQRDAADGGCCSLLRATMRKIQMTARRQWVRKRGKFKPKYIFLYGVLPLGLVVYVLVQLSDIFIDFTYYSDVHLPCDNLTKPLSRIQVLLDTVGDEQLEWQTVVYNETYVLSAFLDSRHDLNDRYHVRILGITDTYKEDYPDTDYCQLWYTDSIIMESVRARRYVIQEAHDLR